ncbi:MAG: hypothetical protein IKB16_01345 [Lentisphaeria bacterium]|nr:hypothetical protein [Lentisphaeria bacterium]
MKTALLIACAAVATFAFTACDDVAAPAAKPAAAKPAAKPAATKPAAAKPAAAKPAGVPTKVYKQIKGIEQNRNQNVQNQLNKM